MGEGAAGDGVCIRTCTRSCVLVCYMQLAEATSMLNLPKNSSNSMKRLGRQVQSQRMMIIWSQWIKSHEIIKNYDETVC